MMLKKICFLITATLGFISLNAQPDSLNVIWHKIGAIESSNHQLWKTNNELISKIRLQQKTIDTLLKVVAINKMNIQQTSDSLGAKINTTENVSNQKYSKLDSIVNKHTLLGVIAFLLAAMISGIVYYLLNVRRKDDKADVINQISKTKTILEEEQVKVYTKIAEIHQSQLDMLKTDRTVNNKAIDPDHSLAKKIADEMVKMQMNISYMDQNIKGLKQLKIALNNMNDNFKANGYEIIDHLNKPFYEGMNMQATMEPDPSLKEGEFFIRRIIKPEIHFENKVIQNAQVIVGFGE
jgi:hypothetical protein